MTDSRILWRRLDTPGHETARIHARGSSRLLTGTAVFAHAAEACRLHYQVSCDSAWRTRSARVEGWLGEQEVDVDIIVDAAESWELNGERCASVHGCTDLDLNFSPSTNLLPICRLRLQVGQTAEVRAAWLRFPSFVLEPLEQVYQRTAAKRYRYQSRGGAFVADLRVNDAGLVTHYPDLWQEESLA